MPRHCCRVRMPEFWRCNEANILFSIPLSTSLLFLDFFFVFVLLFLHSFPLDQPGSPHQFQFSCSYSPVSELYAYILYSTYIAGTFTHRSCGPIKKNVELWGKGEEVRPLASVQTFWQYGNGSFAKVCVRRRTAMRDSTGSWIEPTQVNLLAIDCGFVCWIAPAGLTGNDACTYWSSTDGSWGSSMPQASRSGGQLDAYLKA